MKEDQYPLLYQLNTRVRLSELSAQLGHRATLDDIPDWELDEIAAKGFDWLWLLSVWQTGPASRQVSCTSQEWRLEFERTLPDLKDDDIGGSGFAIADYEVQIDLGGPEALAKLRKRLQKRGLKLLLDFVPNHTGLDHHWIKTNPDYYVSGTEQDLFNAPQNYTRVAGSVFAYGRDPYFAGWPDTVQLNYANPATQEALKEVLLRIAAQCDGVRCDMAMLVTPEVFERTWGLRSQPFWTEATNIVRQNYPDFCFIAEVYWDMEWALQQQGFDYTYDKRLYDRLKEGHAKPVRDHLLAPLDYQQKMARFLENHDEPRAVSSFPDQMHKAAAVVTFLSPGLRFFHQGQFEGRKKRISPHLIRGPEEPVNEDLRQFYDQLLGALKQEALRNGDWRLAECFQAWDGNWSWQSFICFAWTGINDGDDERLLAVVNYAPYRSQCYVRLPYDKIAESQWQLQDQLSDLCYQHDGDDLSARGLYLDMQAWQAHVFAFRRLSKERGTTQNTKLSGASI